MQCEYSSRIYIGRSGLTAYIYKTNESLIGNVCWLILLNGKGFEITRYRDYDDPSVDGGDEVIVSFDTIENPQDIPEDELELITMLCPNPNSKDKDVICLCSILSAMWVEGKATEKQYHEVVIKTLRGWSV